MSWKSRRVKKFARLVSHFERAPIIKIDSFIFIDESAPHTKSRAERDYYSQRMIHSCKQEIKEGTIQTGSDFDNYYSPYFDFTIETNGFEKNSVKANRIAHDCLSKIAKSWKAKVESLYGPDKHIINVYFQGDEWFLECCHPQDKENGCNRYGQTSRK